MSDANLLDNLGRPPEIELLRREAARKPLTTKQTKQLNNYLQGPPDSKDAFIIKKAADWLTTGKNRLRSADKLFDHFWYEGELCIMFADTNVGKSILAVQLGDSLSRGEAIPGFGPARPAEQVLYFDFELTAAQFEKRYSSFHDGNYPFSANFYRLVFNPESVGARRFDSYADYLNNGIENVLVATKARILIIDNITCLRSGTEAAASAVSLMKNLQAIKNKYGLSVLVLAHTPNVTLPNR
ncbi:AAA family ATPase [Mucilaginibacter antarcticus]|uniref:AAA family ATPase n=1 Tax=Mucilaginibacter antarcticus TaxID=1855725 RepID=UPI0036327CA1